ncbi:MAG TPA: DUF4062 domain-containing protein [Kofleriaceae bacterium]|nr:DUF4062 domain-containing protein [Kofleriaceae bacterium]
MRIFICSTAYDLADARDLCAEALRLAGHEPVHHESPLFPHHSTVHSHDRCLLAIADCDALACIVDRRYGGRYAGVLRAGRPPIMLQSGAKKGGPSSIEYGPGDLSITWTEVLEARDLNLPVMTFARQKTLDEWELRKRNPRLKSLRMVHVADPKQYPLFDFLAWTQHQPRDNWIDRFASLTELRDRVVAWTASLSPPSGGARADNLQSTPPGADDGADQVGAPGASPPPSSIGPNTGTAVLIVAGQTDAVLVDRVSRALRLPIRFDIVPVGGRLPLMGSMASLASGYGTKYASVVILVDAETVDEAAAEAELQRIRDQVKGLPNTYVMLAVPDADQWISLLLGEEHRKDRGRLLDRLRAREWTEEDVKRVAARSPSFREYVELLRKLAKKGKRDPSIEEVRQLLIRRAKEAIAEGRKRSGASQLSIRLQLASSAEIEAALALERDGQGETGSEDGRWFFEYTWRLSSS